MRYVINPAGGLDLVALLNLFIPYAVLSGFHLDLHRVPVYDRVNIRRTLGSSAFSVLNLVCVFNFTAQDIVPGYLVYPGLALSVDTVCIVARIG